MKRKKVIEELKRRQKDARDEYTFGYGPDHSFWSGKAQAYGEMIQLLEEL